MCLPRPAECNLRKLDAWSSTSRSQAKRWFSDPSIGRRMSSTRTRWFSPFWLKGACALKKSGNLPWLEGFGFREHHGVRHKHAYDVLDVVCKMPSSTSHTRDSRGTPSCRRNPTRINLSTEVCRRTSSTKCHPGSNSPSSTNASLTKDNTVTLPTALACPLVVVFLLPFLRASFSRALSSPFSSLLRFLS